jgi:hypothetical protein
MLFGVGSDARSASESDPGPRTATHCVDELIGRPTRVTVGSRLGANRKPIHSILYQHEDIPDFYNRLTPRHGLETTCVEEVRRYDVSEYWKELV